MLGFSMTASNLDEGRARLFLEQGRPVTWVALAGFMGTGKSRIGWELSRRLSLTFIDTDRVVERVSNLRIADIFETFGEETFRDYEIGRAACRESVALWTER